MTEPGPALRPHRGEDGPEIAAVPDAPPARPVPISASASPALQQHQPPARQWQMAVAAQAHTVVDQLFRSVALLEGITDEALAASFNDADISDTVKAAAVLARDAYTKALAVEVLTARAMET